MHFFDLQMVSENIQETLNKRTNDNFVCPSITTKRDDRTQKIVNFGYSYEDTKWSNYELNNV